jgi:hypothetical protein
MYKLAMIDVPDDPSGGSQTATNEGTPPCAAKPRDTMVPSDPHGSGLPSWCFDENDPDFNTTYRILMAPEFTQSGAHKCLRGLYGEAMRSGASTMPCLAVPVLLRVDLYGTSCATT